MRERDDLIGTLIADNHTLKEKVDYLMVENEAHHIKMEELQQSVASLQTTVTELQQSRPAIKDLPNGPPYGMGRDGVMVPRMA